MLYAVAALIIVAVSVAIARRTTKTPIAALPQKARGFGDRDAKVVITFADGSSRETTFGEIEKKVKEINGAPFWIEQKWNVILGVISCAIGIAAEAFFYYLERS